MTSLSYCGEMVRKYDPDRFLLAMFEPADKREALFSLYAFNYEIARTRETVTETRLGLIRLQWWRDALAAFYDRSEVLKHQGLEPLCDTIRTYNLPRELFDNLVFAREFDLEDRLPGNLDGMDKYAIYTNQPLLELTLRVLGETARVADIEATAATYGLTGLLRAVPAHLRQRRCYLPEDLIHKNEMSVYDLYDGTGIGKLPPVIGTVLQQAQRQAAQVSAEAPKTLRRMVKLARMYQAQMTHVHGDLFAPALGVPPLLRELRLMWL